MQNLITILLSVTLLVACVNDQGIERQLPELTPPIKTPIELIEEAHKKDEVNSNKAIQFDIQLFFGGKERLNANLTLAANSTKGIIESNDSSVVLYVEDKVYYSDSLKNPKSVRFSAYTWPYFALLPYKLSDPGTHWGEPFSETLADKNLNCQKLTFEQGVGDAPDDWYLVYSNIENNLIEYAAYIVTAGSSQVEAEKDPHAIEYRDYKTVSGIPFAHEWIFWEWREKEGLTKELGHAKLSDIQVVDLDEDKFLIRDSYLTAE
ncbi:MAG: hypothetical protein AAF487_01755 [Bacteroidota bacterium]